MDELRKVNNNQEFTEEPMKSGSVQYIDSREVANMVGKEHSNLLKDIRRYISQMGKVKIDFADFFAESTYSDVQGKKRACFMVTKKGCEFIAHKMTSEKGTIFTATYINRFHEMKGELESGMLAAVQKMAEQQQSVNRSILDGFEKMDERVGMLEREIENLKKGTAYQVAMNPFGIIDDEVIKERMKTLNALVDQVSEIYNLSRVRTLHYLYKTIQEDLGIMLNPYLTVMKSETNNDTLCNLNVIASVDRFYEKAIELNQSVIERKTIYG